MCDGIRRECHETSHGAPLMDWSVRPREPPASRYQDHGECTGSHPPWATRPGPKGPKGTVEASMSNRRNPLIIAHRGAAVLVSHPENTVAAFRRARAVASDWVELDVRRTADAKTAIHHDAHL